MNLTQASWQPDTMNAIDTSPATIYPRSRVTLDDDDKVSSTGAAPRDDDLSIRLDDDGATAMASKKIGTPGRFCFMELSPEIRLMIYPHLLIQSSPIAINYNPSTFPEEELKPSAAILRTCTLVNNEATPILYRTNRFVISLPPSIANLHFFPTALRWSTIACLSSLTYVSYTEPPRRRNTFDLAAARTSSHSTPSTQPALESRDPVTFTCKGTDLLAHFSPQQIRASPSGMSKLLTLSAINWLSIQMVGAQIDACSAHLEGILRHPALNNIPDATSNAAPAPPS